MANSEETQRMKAVLDLKEYVDSIGEDRPPLGVFLKELGIDPKVMSDCVKTATTAAQVTYPEMAVQIINDLFKIGVTIGYKMAIKRGMEEQFGSFDHEHEEDEDE
jgi:hypothetical protein